MKYPAISKHPKRDDDVDCFGPCTCKPDEEQERETSRDVVKAIAAVRPLLQQYRDRYLEVSEHLSRAQSSAAQATRGGRERSQRQLQAFESLRGECAQLGLDLTGEQMQNERGTHYVSE